MFARTDHNQDFAVFHEVSLEGLDDVKCAVVDRQQIREIEDHDIRCIGCGDMLRIGDDFQLGNGTEEKRTFHCTGFNLLRCVEGKRFGNHTSERVHAIKEEQSSGEQTDLNGNGQIENHR